MKVVQINAVIDKGSTGKIVADISDMLTCNNVENYVFYADGLSDRKNAIKISNNLDRKIHAFLSRLFGKQACFSRLSTKRTLRQLDKIKPDVVHLHNLHHNYINLKMLLKYLAKNDIKTVLTLHDCWFFTGKCTHYVTAGCDKWQKECGNCPQLKKDNKSWFFDRTKFLLKQKQKYFSKIKNLKIVPVSYWMSEQVEKSFLGGRSINVISNGINTSIFNPNVKDLRQELGIKDEKVILGMANKWMSPENEGLLDYVLDQLADGYKFLLIGKRIEKENVVCVNYVNSPHELARLYKTADIFVNVTHEDTLPTVNLESMATGTPVVTYKACGSTEIVTEKVGRIVEEYDKFGLVTAIKEVCENSKDLFSAECVKRIVENYDKDKQFLKYLEVYNG